MRGLPRDKGARDNPLAPGRGFWRSGRPERKGSSESSQRLPGEGMKRRGQAWGMIQLPFMSDVDQVPIDTFNLGREAGITLTRSCHLCEAAMVCIA